MVNAAAIYGFKNSKIFDVAAAIAVADRNLKP